MLVVGSWGCDDSCSSSYHNCVQAPISLLLIGKVGVYSELPGMGVFCFHLMSYNCVTWSARHCGCDYLPWGWAHRHSQPNKILLGGKRGKWILERQHTLSATVTNGVLSASSFYIPVQRGFIVSTHPGLTW